MPATSPYTANDYKAADSYRPYQLPVNDIFKAITAQNQFWDAGAARVKNVYDNALNLQLTKEDNIAIRDQFMKDAEKQLTKLSSMDLSDPSVQRQGFGIFKPLFKDEGIMYDDLTTRHYQQVRNDALSYRTKDNGKEYSDTNLAYAMQGYNDFVKSPDRMAGKAAYENRRDYTPFYDPTTELNSILKNCKPSTATSSSVKGYYIYEYSDQSLSSAKINSCLDGGISDRARRQLQINGSVTYRDQLPALRDKYVPHLLGTISQLQEENSAIQGVLANKGTLSNLKPADLAKIGVQNASEITPEFIANLASIKQSNDKRIGNLLTTVSHLKSDDFSDISGSNFEPVAGMMFSRDWMKNVAEGFSYDFTKNTMKADPVQMLFYKEHMENLRQEDKQQFDLNLKKMELQYQLLGKTGNLKTMLGMGDPMSILDNAREDNATTSPFGSIDKAGSYDEVTQKWSDVNAQMGKLDTWLLDKLKTFGLDASVTSTDDAKFKNFYENFKTTAASDPEKKKIVDEYENQLGKYVSVADLYKNTMDVVDAKVNANPELNVTSILNQVKGPETITIRNEPAPGVIDILGRTQKESDLTLSADQMKQLLSTGKSGNIKLVDYHGSAASLSGSGFTSTWTEKALEMNGVTYRILGNSNFEKLLQQDSKRLDASAKAKNELMSRETVLQRESYAFPFLNNNEGTFKTRIAQRIGLPLKYIDDLTIGDTDLDGRVIVRLNTDRVKATKEYDGDMVLNNLKNYGGKDNPTLEDDKSAVMLSGINELDMIDMNKLSNIMKPYMRSLEQRVDQTQKPQSTGFIRSQLNNTSYRLDVTKSYTGGFDYTIYDKNNPSSPVYSSSNRDKALGNFNILVEEKKTIQVPKK